MVYNLFSVNLKLHCKIYCVKYAIFDNTLHFAMETDTFLFKIIFLSIKCTHLRVKFSDKCVKLNYKCV